MALTPPPSTTGGNVSNVSVQPINQNQIPIGTIAEAERENLDPSAYATCAQPRPHAGVVGCSWYDRCRVSAKGQAGPKNYGVEIVKGRAQGGGFVREKANCMWIADHVQDIEDNKGAIKVIANEGESFEQVTGVMVNSTTGDLTHQKDPLGVREIRRVKVMVPKYPRPGENPVLLTDVLRAESIEAEKERRADESSARAYGLDNAIPPIDKRPAGAGEGRKAAGGGKP